MKKYKNVLLALGSIIIAFILIFSFRLIGTGYLFIFYIFAFIGIFFAYKSNKEKEASLVSNIMIIIAVLTLLYPVLDVPIAFIIDSIFR